ncbi:MAG: hypothetical protein K2L14_05920 [Duncaniella sp.]|nr:hypothetical protein [Duncaniella sp.]
METKATIRLQNPSAELVAFMEKASRQKKERMQQMRDRFSQSRSDKF